VPDVLAMSPVIDPGDPPPPEDAPAPFSGDSAWLADYAAAEASGMGITIRPNDLRLPNYVLAEGVERLVVFGIDWTLSPQDTSAGIGALLEAHAASGGFGFLPIGTPTNNTRAGSSGHSPSSERDPEQSPAPGVDGAAGTRAIDALRAAFGLTEETFRAENAARADLDETTLASHMANALYRGLAGNYLEHYWTRAQVDAGGAADFTDEDALALVREHAVRFVRPAGPLQPIRVERQPYGILPVIARDRYLPSSGFERGLNGILELLRPSWASGIAGVTRFDGSAAATNLLLRQGPWAQAASYREVKEDTLGSAVQDTVGQFQSSLRFAPGGFFLQALALTRGAPSATAAMLSALAVARLAVQPDANTLPRSLPWVQADAEIPTREAAPDTVLPPSANYIRILGAALDAGKDIKGAAAGLRSASSLLAGLLAYSVDQEADQAGVLFLKEALRTREPKAQGLVLRPAMSIAIEPVEEDEQSFVVRHAGELSQVRIPQVTGDASVTEHAVRQGISAARNYDIRIPQWNEDVVRDVIDSWMRNIARHSRDLASVRASLADLETRTVGELDWAFRTTLDMFDWRLDAWITSLATRRLAELRTGRDDAGAPQRVPGIHLGAWGFVEELRPDPPGNRESLGHMLMPSLRHAAAAAILRSGYLANDPGARAAFDLDLSSRRVRAAAAVYEGLAQGQTIAALLGYRFERGLRDGLLGEFILTYRQTYPMRPADLNAQGEATGQPAEAIAARDVVDGVKLLEAGAAAAAVVPGPRRAAVQALLDDLDSLWDAVADLSVAEAIFQIAQGNVERAAAALTVLDKQSTPVEAQVALSPREGVRYTQRVVLLFDAHGGDPQGWPADETAAAEPKINAWLAQLIGDPARFVLRGHVFEGGNEVNEPIEVSPADLGMSPLALLLALDAPGAGRMDTRVGPAAGGGGPGDLPPPDPNHPQVAELSRLRLALAETLRAQAIQRFGADVFVHIEEAPADPATPGLLHLEALLALARRLVTRSRPAVRSDLAVIEGRFDRNNDEGNFPGADPGEIAARAAAAADALAAKANALFAAIPAGENDPIDADAVSAALSPLRPFGVLGAEEEAHRAFASEAERDESVRGRVRAAVGDLNARQTRIDDLRGQAEAPGAKPVVVTQNSIDILKTVFGKDFPAVPLFTLGTAVDPVNAGLASQDALTAGDPSVVAGWLPKISKVREGAENLQSLLLAREALVGSYGDECFGVVQSPANPDSVWAALPGAWPDPPGEDVTASDLLATGRRRPDLAVAIHAPAGLPENLGADTGLAGLVCDDWAETVPQHTNTAAVAFHYDAPGARAPQTILLAVPPVQGMASWSFDDLLDTVNETIELARLRAVCPAQVSGAANLALPLNLIQDAETPTVPGMNIKAMATVAYAQAASDTAKTLAIGKA
jgi:hypothetical protein